MVGWGEKWGVEKGYLTVYGILPVMMKEYMIQLGREKYVSTSIT